MLISAAASALMAWPAWVGIPVILIVLQGINGMAQSTGWPGLLKLTRDWFPTSNRGVTLGWWSTNMVAGGFAGTWIAARAAEGHWTRGAWVPSIVLAGIATAFVFGIRDRASRREPGRTPARLVLTPPLAAITMMYFCVKMTRYAFLFWLPLYMTEYLSYAKPQAGYASSVFELIGFLGVLVAGYISERRAGSRFTVAASMLFCLAILCATYPMISKLGLGANLAAIALIGAFTFGPDTLMAAAALQDIVPAEATATAGGFVNGVGSIGQLLSPYVVRYGWPALFNLLAAVSLVGAIALASQGMLAPRTKQETAH
jgi:sugar phosphate permease